MRAERSRSGIRVVLDTNVWISAALSSGGAPASAVRFVLAQHRVVLSTAIFAELESRLWRAKFDRYLSMETRRQLLHDIAAVADWIEIPDNLAQTGWSRDADDDHFIRAALASGAQLLITGDADLLEVPEIPGLVITDPARSLQLLRSPD